MTLGSQLQEPLSAMGLECRSLPDPGRAADARTRVATAPAPPESSANVILDNHTALAFS